MKNKKPTILTFVHYYLPGYKSGGPIRTIANLVDHLSDEFDFRIITSDRDALDQCPYPGIAIDDWTHVGKAEVYYLSPARQSVRALAKLISGTRHDLLYLNSFFDPIFTFRPLLARRLGWLPKRPVIVAPRGEFAPSALALKRWKKLPYLTTAQAIGLYRNIIWQASSNYEVADIERVLGPATENIVVALNLPPAAPPDLAPASIRQPSDPLRIIFLSRITPMKNLDFALRVLSRIKIPALFNIYGPVRDEGYWAGCQQLIKQVPSHVKIEYRGSVNPEQVHDIIAAHDLFFLPTRGENYGHVIAEALTGGTPVLIANTTPWRGLEEVGVGWDLPLNDENCFISCIEHCTSLTALDYLAWRERIRKYATTRLTDAAVFQANRQLFSSVIF